MARFWRTCPGPAAPGARVAYADEREIQHATDMGAAVIVVPTVDSVEEAQEAVNWTYFPPLGRRSAGGGQGASEIWNDVPGGYRQTWNDNVVLILMIETLEGVENAREIARIPGVTGLFAASGDLGNFSGFGQGDREYEALITEVATAAKEAGIHACAPLRWADRPDFTCFQAGTEAANIRRGAAAELQQAAERYGSTGGGGAGRTPSEAGRGPRQPDRRVRIDNLRGRLLRGGGERRLGRRLLVRLGSGADQPPGTRDHRCQSGPGGPHS